MVSCFKVNTLVDTNYFCYLCTWFKYKFTKYQNITDGIILKFTNYVSNQRTIEGT